ncbi:hypothetical protein Tsp_10085 [Trichinella spiralis]|uniref:hypothetical protein n=1 Tax=Trichinella spiralis TaxID=6334 RepID=UPI0001EFD110|nr:hypothetical protein Tsp_10085 [Trichinella spiralis]
MLLYLLACNYMYIILEKNLFACHSSTTGLPNYTVSFVSEKRFQLSQLSATQIRFYGRLFVTEQVQHPSHFKIFDVTVILAIFYVPADQNDVLNGSRCRHHCPNVPEGIKKCTRHDSVMGQVVIGSRVSLLVVEHADDRRECRDEADCPPCLKAASGSYACLNSVHVRSSSAFCRTVVRVSN